MNVEAVWKYGAKPLRSMHLVAVVLPAIMLCSAWVQESRAAVLPAGVHALADSGTGEPFDSETPASPGEDEPPAEGEQRPAAPQEGERSPGDDFGCPVREQGPYPLLI